MKASQILFGTALSTSALAWPGMAGDAEAMAFHDQLVRRAHSADQLDKRAIAPFPPGIQQSGNTGVAKQIKDCLNGATECQVPGAKTYVAPGAIGSDACKADTCCIWNYISGQLAIDFAQSDGQCNSLARGAIRLGFHDAGAWSLTSGYGGADGSMLISDEILRSENDGLQAIVTYGQGLLAQYNVGAADLVQMMANVATVVCPLAPRVFSFVGRKDSPNSPDDLLPGAFSSASVLLQLFEDKTINAFDLAALVGAHSTSTQSFVDVSHAGSPQDVTPGVWDVLFYSETMNSSFKGGITKFPSDVNLANDPATSGAFAQFGDPTTGQTTWNTAYARAYVRLSLLGVNNVDDLVDCTKVLPHEKNTGNPNLNKSSSSVTLSATSSVSLSTKSSSALTSSGALSSSSSHSSFASFSGFANHSSSASESSYKPTSSWPSESNNKPTSSGHGGYASPSVSSGYKGPSYVTSAPASWSSPSSSSVCGHTGADGTWTTTVTSYYTKNGWHIPKSTVTCAEKDMPEWAKATASVGDLYQQWQKGLIGDGGNAPSFPGVNAVQPTATWFDPPSCIATTVYATVTTTVW